MKGSVLPIITLFVLLKKIGGQDRFESKNDFQQSCKLGGAVEEALFPLLPDFGCGPKSCIYSCHGATPQKDGSYVSLWSKHYQMALFSAAVVKPRQGVVKRPSTWDDDVGNNHDADYRVLPEYQRGHLFPILYTKDQEQAKLTMRLSNAVPQAGQFNNGVWKTAEGQLKENFIDHCHAKDETLKSRHLAVVIVGAVPGYFGYGMTPSTRLNNPNIRTGNPLKNFNNLLI